MKRLRKRIRMSLGFSRRETNGFLVFMPLILLILFSRPIILLFYEQYPDDFSREGIVLDSLISAWKIQEVHEDVPALPPAARFKFDPNSASAETLAQLGFSKAVADRVVSYRSKGGKFRAKEDLLKIYGIDSSLIQRLYPYITIPKPVLAHIEKSKSIEGKESVRPFLHAFDLNTARVDQLVAVQGIGPVLAERIVKYRDRLGGFVSVSQLHEVYGLDSVVIDRLVIPAYLKDSRIRTISLNAATERDLEQHPYISKAVAKAIVSYRFQHGSFRSVHELRKIQLINEQLIDKILPYLTVE